MLSSVFFIIILLIALSLYAGQRIPNVVTASITMVLLIITGLTSVEEAFSGFSNPAVLTIASMFILSAGLINTGALIPIADRINRWSRQDWKRMMLAIAITVVPASAFVATTPVVVIMMPAVLSLCRQNGFPPSKALMPLSYLCIMGGMLTLFGTSTNLIVNNSYREHVGESFLVFEFTWMALAVIAVGLTYILLLGRKWLPERETLSSILAGVQRSKYVTEVLVPQDSPWIGKTYQETLGKSTKTRILQLQRSLLFYVGTDAARRPLQADDALILEGSGEALTTLITQKMFQEATVLDDSQRVPIREFNLRIAEVVVRPDSTFIGSRIKRLDLYKRFGVSLLAIQRGGRNHRMDLRNMFAKEGDVLLVQAEAETLEHLKNSTELLVVEDTPFGVFQKRKALTAFGVMAAVVLTSMLAHFPIAVCALGGAAMMLALNCLRLEEAFKALDLNVLALLIGTIPLGIAFEKTPLFPGIGETMMTLVGDAGPYLMLAILYLITNILTSLLSNAAVAVLMTPLAIDMAHQMGISPKPFAVSVCFAATMAFASPIGYQTNIIVMGPAGYRFSDYLRFGLPLCLLAWLTVWLLTPIFWPFVPIT